MLEVTDSLGNMIAGEVTTQMIDKEAKKDGMISLLQDGYIKVLEGVTSLEEVMRVANEALSETEGVEGAKKKTQSVLDKVDAEAENGDTKVTPAE